MAETHVDFLENVNNSNYHVNVTCDYDSVPSAVDYIESLGVFGVSILSVGSILSTVTLYLAIDASYNVLLQKESKSYKTNCLLVISVYPIASICSLLAAAIPRVQLLSEALTQISLTISLYRLFLLLIDIGRRNVTKEPPLQLKVGPCCCWPCLPFPTLEMTETNLAWLRSSVLQLPIVQGITYCVFLILSTEQPSLFTKYGDFLQPLSIMSILVALYGLNVTSTSLQEDAPGSNIFLKATILKMVLLFSKLQGGIIKSLAGSGLFPCNPPLTPIIYANLTFNTLMVVEMLLLCYVARHVYNEDKNKDNPESPKDESLNKDNPRLVSNNNDLPNIELPVNVAAATA